ncbi:hypothetical protein [Desulfosporosinus sp. Sb-LF]|uniref:hypothetical protein n=1 Tax=Desulfosporosinus sp. Sb-LF TaxID=2560027 RepID=UPI00107F42C7|nr:hypothetical protein [Desulfosporosinus sp. Sb-LF]TGE31912.1 hypothetical protein E4K68_14570 [Desulfosporosinus sp. Sb-LF]
MLKIKPRRILAVLGVVIIVVGGYAGWQVYSGQQMANQYVADAQQQASGASNGSASSNTQTSGSKGNTSLDPTNSGQTSPSGTSPSSAGSSLDPSSSSPANSSAPGSASGASNPGEYKLLMTKTYQQTLQAMQTVKSNTLALQSKNLSISAYRSSILQSQATFTAAEEFVRANPPTEEKLNPSYQEFLAGISLAKESMGVVLKGITSFSPANLYAAREMGKKAQQQVAEGYSHL